MISKLKIFFFVIAIVQLNVLTGICQNSKIKQHGQNEWCEHF